VVHLQLVDLVQAEMVVEAQIVLAHYRADTQMQNILVVVVDTMAVVLGQMEHLGQVEVVLPVTQSFNLPSQADSFLEPVIFL
jgi:hypothetical protein